MSKAAQLALRSADVVICGAGMAGCSVAYHLAKNHGVSNVVVVTKHSPLSLTSSLSTECYRDFWEDKSMGQLVGRSIDIMEDMAADCDNAFDMTRRGYAFFTANDDELLKLERMALGMGEKQGFDVRMHSIEEGGAVDAAAVAAAMSAYPEHLVGSMDMTAPESFISGIDVVRGSELVQSIFPEVSSDVCGMVHARRCGWVSAQQMGVHMMNSAKELGVTFVMGDVTEVECADGEVAAVHVDVQGDKGPAQRVATSTFVNAAGPLLNVVHALLPGQDEHAAIHKLAEMRGTGAMAGATTPDGTPRQFPLRNEVHAKTILRDVHGIVPRDAPMMIWSDEQRVWEDEGDGMAEMLEEALGEATARKLLSTAPSGVHLRPYAYDSLLLLWEFWHHDVEADGDNTAGGVNLDLSSTLDFDLYPEVCLRGISAMVPGMSEYVENCPPGAVSMDGGYYTQTPENMPLVGPVSGDGAKGAYVCGALSGFGVMSSCGAGELLAATITNSETDAMKEYAPAMSPHRYADEEHAKVMDHVSINDQI